MPHPTEQEGAAQAWAATEAVAKGLRLYARMWLGTIALALPLVLLRPELIPLSRGGVLAVSCVALGVNLVASFLPWERLLERPLGRAAVEAYPVTLSLIGSAMTAVTPWTPLFAVTLIGIGAVGGMLARPRTMAILVGAPVLGLFIADIRNPEANDALLLLIGASAVAVTCLTYIMGRTYQRGLATTAAESGRHRAHATRLATLAEAAKFLPSVDGNKVVQALVDVVPMLGWEVGGIFTLVPDGRRDYRLSGHCGLPDALVGKPGTQLDLFRAVRDAKDVVAFDDYPDRAGADPDWSAAVATALAAPITAQGNFRGAIIVGTRVRRRSTPGDIQTLELLAGLACRAVELAEQYEQREVGIRELQRISQRKQDFLGTVSHELRTPLSVVLGMAETIDVHWDALPEQQRRDMMTRLHVNAASLERVIEALLDFSRLEAGMVEPRRRPVALTDVVKGVVQRLEVITGDHDVAVGDADAALHAWADPILIERVVENLVTNACRHTPPGTAVRIHVREEEDRATVEVADEGPGIEPADLAHLGERFYRGGNPLTRSSKGLGLGLAFCRQVLAMHDSELQVRSVPGRGTSFWFTLSNRVDDEVDLDEDGDEPIAARRLTGPRSSASGPRGR